MFDQDHDQLNNNNGYFPHNQQIINNRQAGIFIQPWQQHRTYKTHRENEPTVIKGIKHKIGGNQINTQTIGQISADVNYVNYQTQYERTQQISRRKNMIKTHSLYNQKSKQKQRKHSLNLISIQPEIPELKSERQNQYGGLKGAKIRLLSKKTKELANNSFGVVQLNKLKILFDRKDKNQENFGVKQKQPAKPMYKTTGKWSNLNILPSLEEAQPIKIKKQGVAKSSFVALSKFRNTHYYRKSQ